jgi:hypothetical protein
LAGKKSEERNLKKRHTAVYFRETELVQIKKAADKSLLDVSPFIRKKILEDLGITLN